VAPTLTAVPFRFSDGTNRILQFDGGVSVSVIRRFFVDERSLNSLEQSTVSGERVTEEPELQARGLAGHIETAADTERASS
jgi:hypothetical protein